MANWLRMMGVTAARGPSFHQPLATLVQTTQAMPIREGRLCQAIGTRTGMAEPPEVGPSTYSACGGGPQAGGGLSGLVAPRVLPQAERLTPLVPPRPAPFPRPPILPEDIGFSMVGPGDQSGAAFAFGETCEDVSEDPVKTPPDFSRPAAGGVDPGMKPEQPSVPGNGLPPNGTYDPDPP
jgi:hypothetical protein